MINIANVSINNITVSRMGSKGGGATSIVKMRYGMGSNVYLVGSTFQNFSTSNSEGTILSLKNPVGFSNYLNEVSIINCTIKNI